MWRCLVAGVLAATRRYLTQQLVETLTEQQGAEAHAACRRNVARVDGHWQISGFGE